ncbi:tetratricopeptide repeat protein [Pontiella desulfatans]|uniref:tetratricopeptide repeat protein n=1 Tax=Pontiella desulfatans TaxID=2750659 RepID=UPI00109C090D|nr:hypothetical protein [Pontiella desulfatans]
MKKKAMAFERGGEPLKAAQIYEQIALDDASSRKVLAIRLVKIYASEGQKDNALKWAKSVIEDHPDPQAYMAGVYAMLGECSKAINILEKEIAKTKDPDRTLTLYWQLANVHEQNNDPEKTEKALSAAVFAAKGTRLEATAQRQLDRFRNKKAE